MHILHGDLTDPASLITVAKEVSKLTGGAVDHLIINGAYLSEQTMFMKPGDFVGKETQFLDELNASMHTNVAGALYSVNAFIPLLKSSAIKKVVVVSSGMADPGIISVSEIAESIPYAMSKAAANILVAKYAVEYKKDGIIFLALSPGYVQTRAEDPDNGESYLLYSLDLNEVLILH